MTNTARAALLLAFTAAATPAIAGDAEMLEKGVKFLASQQREDGSFGSPRGADPGITGLCLRALADAPVKSDERTKALEKGTAWLLGKQKEDGSFSDGRAGFTTYRTSMAILALCSVDRAKHSDAILKARKWLESAQYDDKDSPQFGGFGYEKGGKPNGDLSNAQMAIAALKEAGAKPDDPVMKRAIEFVSRLQNNTETNKGLPELKIVAKNDGGFYYSLGRDKGVDNGDGTSSYESYASMTYAGLLSLSYAGLSKDDPRVKAALGWVKDHYTLEENTGYGARGTKGSQAGLFYYYYTLARTLDALGMDELDTKEGKKKWARDLLDALAARQKEDGSWVNPADRFMEGMPVLATAFALEAGSVAMKRAGGAAAPGKKWM